MSVKSTTQKYPMSNTFSDGLNVTSGKGGIGTASPAVTLDVIGTGSFALAESSLSQGIVQIGVDSGGNTGGELMFHTDDYIGLRCADSGALSFVVKPDGKVGVGTTDPAQVLDVIGIGSFALAESSQSQGVVQVGVDSGGDPGGELMFHTDDYVGIRCADSGAVALAIKPSGNVGIGTVTPDCMLHVAGAAAFSGPSETFVTFGSSDTTPSVATGNLFKTHASGQTLTTFDDGVAGQTITVISTAAVVFDVTGTTLKGGSADITTASGDVTEWTYDGTNWYLQQFMDVSADMSSVGGGGGGGISSVETKTGNYTADTDDDVILCNAAALTITLPAVSGNTGQTYYIKNIHATGVATIDADGSETIDGALQKYITTQYESLTLVCNGTAWFII